MFFLIDKVDDCWYIFKETSRLIIYLVFKLYCWTIFIISLLVTVVQLLYLSLIEAQWQYMVSLVLDYPKRIEEVCPRLSPLRFDAISQGFLTT